MKAVDRTALRLHYSLHPTQGIHFTYTRDHESKVGVWILSTPESVRTLSERAALTRLGHLRPQHGYVPTNIVGMSDAVLPEPKEKP